MRRSLTAAAFALVLLITGLGAPLKASLPTYPSSVQVTAYDIDVATVAGVMVGLKARVTARTTGNFLVVVSGQAIAEACSGAQIQILWGALDTADAPNAGDFRAPNMLAAGEKPVELASAGCVTPPMTPMSSNVILKGNCPIGYSVWFDVLLTSFNDGKDAAFNNSSMSVTEVP